MSAIYDNWERLVAAVLRKEELWQLFHQQSRSPSISSESSSLSFSFGLGSASLDDVPISFSSPEWPAVDQKESDNDSKPAVSASILVKDQTPVETLSTNKSVTCAPSRKRNLKIEVPKRQILHHWPDDEKQQSYPLPLPPEARLNSSPLSQPNLVVTSPSVPLPRPERPENVKSPTSWKKGKLIGRGPFGDVYIGFNSEIGEMCAMKEISLSFDGAKAKQTARMVEIEMALFSRIKHPNIVQFYGTETVGDVLYMYFEYVSGGSIYMILQEYGKLGESVIRSYTQQILSGLAYLHSKFIAHRDIKGANILVDPNGTVKLCNYGIEKHIARQSHPSLLMDSAYWMAPEVIRNPNACNLSIDIWSLGCTVLEMATSKPPLSLHDTVVGMFKIANHEELPKIPDYLSDEAKDFLRLCLQWNPDHRATASQLLEHPFVKPSSPSEKQIPVSTPSGHPAVTNAVTPEGTDHPRIRHQWNRSPKSNFHSSDIYTPRNISSLVSPVVSPLQHLRSPQHLKGTMSPPSQTTSSLSTLLIGGTSAIPYPHLNQSVLPKENFYNQPKHSPGLNSPSYWDPNILRGLHSRSHEFQELARSDNDAPPRVQFGKGANGQPYEHSVLAYPVPQQLRRTPGKLNPLLI
ncbi:MEKK [Handroanthus impetiginosus]|uniref:MEKK n=1 Tax=Handroanthus impetiginosus TaxID=429701 RepID=A0A2G9I615_9LAMI|nr:MEKK [Handroanthus impetiginosus]